MHSLLNLEPSETVVWRVRDETTGQCSVVAKRCACRAPRIPGLDSSYCPKCRTHWIDACDELPDVRWVFALGDAATPADAIYIGRARNGMHFGNPFSHIARSAAAVHVPTVEAAIVACEDWLTGKDHAEVEPARRAWILEHLENLRDRALTCYCAPAGGVNLDFKGCCHGQVYLRLLKAKKRAEKLTPILSPAPKPAKTAASRKPPAAKTTLKATPTPAPQPVTEPQITETQMALFPELETTEKQPTEPYALQPGAWHLPGFLNREEQQDLLEWLREHGGKRLAALQTPSGLDFSVKVASIGRKWVPYKYLDVEDEPFQFKLEVTAKSALIAAQQGSCPEFLPDTAILNYYSPTAKLSLHQDDSESEAMQSVGSPIVTIALGMSCRARQGNCTDKNQPYQDFTLASGDAWVMFGASRKAYHGVMRLLPNTHPPWLAMKSPGRLSLSIRQSR